MACFFGFLGYADLVSLIGVCSCLFDSAGGCSSVAPTPTRGSAPGPLPSQVHTDPVASAILVMHSPALSKLKRRFGEESPSPASSAKKSRSGSTCSIKQFFQIKGSSVAWVVSFSFLTAFVTYGVFFYFYQRLPSPRTNPNNEGSVVERRWTPAPCQVE
jgi:hypothetical protein